MMDRDTASSSRPRFSAVILDCGVDSETCGEDAVEISERGMKLKSHFQFEIGTQLEVAFVRSQPPFDPERIALDAMVVWCEPQGKRCFESTLLFLELPEDLKQHLREFSFSTSTAP